MAATKFKHLSIEILIDRENHHDHIGVHKLQHSFEGFTEQNLPLLYVVVTFLQDIVKCKFTTLCISSIQVIVVLWVSRVYGYCTLSVV